MNSEGETRSRIEDARREQSFCQALDRRSSVGRSEQFFIVYPSADLNDAKIAAARWKNLYNLDRPHSLDGQTPAEFRES